MFSQTQQNMLPVCFQRTCNRLLVDIVLNITETAIQYVRRVYDTNHSILAMVALGAVEPNGIGVIDSDDEGGLRLAAVGVEVARVEPVCQRSARRIE